MTFQSRNIGSHAAAKIKSTSVSSLMALCCWHSVPINRVTDMHACVCNDGVHLMDADCKVAVLAFDCVRGTCPSYFCGICTPLTEVGGRMRLCSAHRRDLCVPSTRTEFGKRSFRVATPRTWNSLALHLHSQTIS